MKAADFVKKFGLNTTENYADHCVDINDLKRLIESHELVESYGGLEKSRKHLNEKCVFEWTALDGKLSQAICDVESCL